MEVAAANISLKPSDLGNTTANYIAKSVYDDPYFKGTVSDFRIYDKALSAEEIAKVTEEQQNSYTPTAPQIISVTGDGIKSYGVEIDSANMTLTIPVKVGYNTDNLSPVIKCEKDAVAELTSGTYKSGVITVTDPDNSSLKGEWTVTAVERGNAVLDGYYADPNIAIFNGKYYIYPTTDGGSGWDAPYFKCFSSDDLVNWTDEGVILNLRDDVDWSNGKNGWAPTIAEKNGRYYFYYSAAPADNGAKNLAVAVADSPTGPFEDKGVIAQGGSYSGQMIDPAVFIDDDGQAYLYWGNGSTMHAAKLSEDMLSIDGAVKDYQPGNFREGAFMIKRNGVYYLMWSADDTGSPDYRVYYGTMDSPLGTLTGSNLVLQRTNADSNLIKGTGHHSVINIPGTDDWYICYHRFNTALYGNQATQSSEAGNHREVCIDKLEFDASGNIKRVVPTLAGITEPVTLPHNPVNITEATVDGNKLHYTLTAADDISDVDVYAALYSTDGTLEAVTKNSMNGELDIDPTREHLLKVFTWKKGTVEPVGLDYARKYIKAYNELELLAADLAPDSVIYGNQYMPSSYKGASITWTTDNAAVTSSGEVTRGNADTEVNIKAVFNDGAYTYEKEYTSTVLAAVTGKEESDMGAYLFVHFVGEEGNAESEQIYFSVSKDGQNWSTLNNSLPVLTSALREKGVRDPHIIRSPEGDKFFLVATDLSIYNRRGDSERWGTCQRAGSRSIMIWESTDLVHWSEQRVAKVAVSDAGCTWAPESVYDNEKGEYMVFWASKVAGDNYTTQRVYRSYTRDFEHFTDPEVYIDGGNVSNIDTTFLTYNGTYYRFTKNETKSSVTMMQSNNLDSGFTDVPTYTINGTAGNTVTGYEGPTIYKLNGENKWCLLLDYYSMKQGYKPFITSDITKGAFTSAADFNFDTKYRHGTVIPITNEEYKDLIGAYTQTTLAGASKVAVGDTAQYAAGVNGETAAAKWSVSDNTIAKISSAGVLTAKSAGTVTVTAELTDYGVSVTKDVEIVSEIEPIDRGLAMHITFDETGAGTGSFNASLGGAVKENGTVSYAAGKHGNAVSMAYAAGNYLELPDGILSGASEASVSFWLKQNSASNNGWAFMTTPVSGKQTYEMEQYLGILLDKAQNKMTAERYYSPTKQSRPAQLSVSGSFGGWNYITVNYASDATTIYINGEKAGEGTSAVNLSNLFTAGAKSWIGHGNWESGEGFAGMIDDFRLYSRTLTEDEIHSLMSAK